MTTFTPQILNSQEKFNAFLNPKKELQEITKLIDNDSIRIPTKDRYYFGRWKIVWIIVTTPFFFITAVFVEAIKGILTSMCITRFNSYLQTLVNYLRQDIVHLKTQWKFGKRFIVPSRNEHQLSSSDIYRQAPIKRKDCLLARTYPHKPNIPESLKFYSPEGVCAGGSFWFNLLVINTLKNLGAKFSQKRDMSSSLAFKKGYIPRYITKEALLNIRTVEKISIWQRFFSKPDPNEDNKKKKLIEFAQNFDVNFAPRHHPVKNLEKSLDKIIASVALQFYSGIPRQGALLQALQLEVLDNHLKLPNFNCRFHIQKKSISNEDINNLPNGTYLVSVGNHAVSYLKFGNKQYIWDSIHGLLLMENAEHVIKHLKKYIESYRLNKYLSPNFFISPQSINIFTHSLSENQKLSKEIDVHLKEYLSQKEPESFKFYICEAD